MKQDDTLPTMACATLQDWEAWLSAHHQEIAGIWLKLAKKGSGIASLSYGEAVEGALCYGWIDSQKVAFDAEYWLQRFTPRRARSVWSRVNRDAALALIAAGRMKPVGLQQVELARSDGRWEAAYASQRTMAIPDDFQEELNHNPQAQAFYRTLNSANRYAILWRIETAKKQETRAAWIAKFIAMLTKGEKIHA